jgi:hypothetical protein
MGLSLRIDADNPFGYATRFRKILNRLSLDYNLVPHWPSLGYLENAERLANYLYDHSVPATWYFRNITAPKKGRFGIFQRDIFDLELHAERTDTLESFTIEVEQWSRVFGARPRGFTKHGSGDLKLSRKHVKEYDDDTFIEFGVNLGFSYFLGNGIGIDQGFEMRGDLVFIPSVLWLDNMSLYPSDNVFENALEYSRKNPLVVLVHPIRWVMQPETQECLEQLIEQAKLETVISQVNAFKAREQKP